MQRRAAGRAGDEDGEPEHAKSVRHQLPRLQKVFAVAASPWFP
jgi:hypothetical protein